MELVSSTDQVGETSSNEILIGDPSNHLLEGGPVEEGPKESLSDEVANRRLIEDVPNKCLPEEVPDESFSGERIVCYSLPEEVPTDSLSALAPTDNFPEEVPDESFSGERIAYYSLPEEVPTDSLSGLAPTDNFPEEVPSECLSDEVPGSRFSEEVQIKIVTDVEGVGDVEEASSLDLSQRPVNGFVEVPIVEVLVNGAQESGATREAEKVLNGIREEEAAKVQTNGWAPDVYDTSVLLPPWNQARVPGPAVMISDMRGVDSLNYSKAEKLLRCKVAASYRLVDIFGWSDGVNANISALTNSGDVLVTALGILHHEVTSSSLVKISLGGDVVDSGSTGLNVDTNDLMLHAAIYRSRNDVRCIMRFSSPIVVAFSSLKCGLLQLCPEAMELGKITYMDYFGAICSEEDETLLGLVQHQNSKVMFLRNFGVVVCGDSVEQAFDVACNVFAAIETQLSILPVGLANIYMPSEEKQRVFLETTSESPLDIHPSKIDRRLEDVRFEGFMRMLDGAGYQTGYSYRFPFMSKRTARSQSLMEVAHSTKSSVSDASRAHDLSLQVSYEPSRSVTPSSQRPASVTNTKSAAEIGQSCQTTSHRFVPLGTDVREYKQKVKQIRKEFMPNRATSGPHSTLLEGVTWDEARRIQESHTGGVGVKVTAASRGIIQRDHQKSAVFFKEFSAGNPFDAVSKKELDDYVHSVQRKIFNPVPPSTTGHNHDLEKDKLPIQEPVKELKQLEKPNAEQEQNKTTIEPVSTKVADLDQTLNIEIGRQSKTESQDVAQRIIKDKETVAGSSDPSENKKNLAAGITEEKVSPIRKIEQPVGSLDQRPIKQETTEPGKVEAVSSVKEEKPQEPCHTVPSPVASVQVKQGEKQTQVISDSKSQDSSHDASKSAKLRKSQSVMESDTNKGASSKESGAEGVELRTKEKKKRGLSAIFSKKKDK